MSNNSAVWQYLNVTNNLWKSFGLTSTEIDENFISGQTNCSITDATQKTYSIEFETMVETATSTKIRRLSSR